VERRLASYVGVACLCCILSSAVGAFASVPANAGSSPKGQSALVRGWGLGALSAVSSDGANLWVITDCGYLGGFGDGLIELSGRTGEFIREVTDIPSVSGVLGAVDGRLWVSTATQSGIVEVSEATGRTERVISSTYIDIPQAIATVGADVWVASLSYLAELNAATGVVLRHTKLPPQADPTSLVVAHGYLWMADEVHHDVQKYRAVTGTLSATLRGSTYAFSWLGDLVTNGSDLWVQDDGAAGAGVRPITEISAISDSVVKVLRGGYGFEGDNQILLDGSSLLVHNSNSTVSVIAVTNDHLIRRVALPNRPGLTAGPATWLAEASDRVWIYDQLPSAPGLRQVDVSDGRIMKVVVGSPYEFNRPTGIATDGTHLWVTSGTAVTEISATDGSLLRVLRGTPYSFNAISISADSTHVWVLNESGAISELSAATGQLQQTISGSYCTTKTTAISDDGSNVWVTCQSDLVAEFSDATGKLVRTISGADSQLDDPIALSSDGQKVWVIDKGSGAITAYDATTGDLDISINQVADAVSSDGTHVWLSVVESTGLTRYGAHVVELEASNGSVVASIPTTSDAPVAIAADGAHTLVAECACDFEYNDFGYNDYGGVDEIDPTSSGEVELLGAPTNAINGPTSVVVAGGRAWITDQWGDSVTGFSLGW
jgi:hypothetical protein